MPKYLAVRTGPVDAAWSLFYVVDTETGLALSTHGSWEDAVATARLGNEEEVPKG